VTHDGHGGAHSTHDLITATSKSRSPSTSHRALRQVSMEDETTELDERSAGAQTVDKCGPTPYEEGKITKRAPEPATQKTPLTTISLSTASVSGGNEDDVRYQRASASMKPLPIDPTAESPSQLELPADDASVHLVARDCSKALAERLSASHSKTVTNILDAVRSVTAASAYVRRFEMLRRIWLEVCRAYQSLREPHQSSKRRLKLIISAGKRSRWTRS